jgi:hypothetical protein
MAINQYFANKSNNIIARQISKGKYDTRQLIELKIKQSLPTIHDWADYENIAGQIQLSGTSYNYVKMRITRDTLYLQCIPNYETTKLINENIICAKNLGKLPVSKKTHESSDKKLGTDAKYNCLDIAYSFITPEEQTQQPDTFIYISIPDPVVPVGGQPPEIIPA